MEVPGKREINNLSCKPCEESDALTQADGFCTNCEEPMCSSCFNAHKRYKFNRDHTLMDCNEEITRREDSSNFEKCEQHLNEAVKFYCAQHEQVGCGDCMVIGHRSCKVDYILDKANYLTGTTELESLTKRPEICTTEAKRLLSSIKDNKVQVDDINDKFKQDVNLFLEEITTQINTLRDRILKEGECIKDRDTLSLTKLEGDTESLISDLNVISDLYKSKVQSPSQLFVCSVSQKPKLDRLMKQLNDIKSRNKIEPYEFIKDSKITSTLASLGQLWRLQEDKDLYGDKQSSSAPPLGKIFKKIGWSCECCLINNKDADSKCVACQTPKPGGQKPKGDKQSSSAPFLSEIFKKIGWSCECCLINNKDADSKCVACHTPKPGGQKPKGDKQSSSAPLLSEMFKKIGSSCEVCLINNKDADSKCVACHTPKPGGQTPKDQEEITEQGLSKLLKTFEDAARRAVSSPLLERQLICRHMKVDGEYLTYADNRNDYVGLYVDKYAIVAGRNFEIEILSLGEFGTIALGLVPDDYPANNHPGWKHKSIGYRGDNGRLYHGRRQGTQFGPTWHVGDKIGFQIYQILKCRDRCFHDSFTVNVVFTRNGKGVGTRTIDNVNFRLYPAIGMQSSGEKVKVILDA